MAGNNKETFCRNNQFFCPNLDEPGLVHFIRALGYLGGLSNDLILDNIPQSDQHTKEMIELIGSSDHYLFILIDGMGTVILDKLGGKDFLRQNKYHELQTVFPSGTTAALTSLATMTWPSCHGFLGWQTFLKKQNLQCNPLPFIERFSKKPLKEFGIFAEDFFSKKVLKQLPQEIDRFAIIPADYVNSPFADFSNNGAKQIGYKNMEDVTVAINEIYNNLKNRTFTYFYFPMLDKLWHEYGSLDFRVAECLKVVDEFIRKIYEQLEDKVRILVTADHGLVDTPKEKAFTIHKQDKIMKFLRTPPSGEARTSFFHVKTAEIEAFQKEFLTKFGDEFCLLSRKDLEELGLLLPGALSQTAIERLGDFIAIPKAKAFLEYVENPKDYKRLIGNHGGLSQDEMHVPLFIF